MEVAYGRAGSRFRSTLTQSSLAFAFNLGGLAAGFFASFAFQSINRAIFLVLLPAILTVRGDIGGILSGRLGTALHTGRIVPSLRRNTAEFYSLLRGIFVLTFLEMAAVGLMAYPLSAATLKVDVKDLYLYVLLPSLTGCSSAVISIPLTSILAILTFRKGLDPDVIVYPAMSMINDIVIIIIYFGIAWILLLKGGVSIIVGFLTFFFLVATSTFFFIRGKGERTFSSVLREGFPVVLFCGLIGTLSGVLLGGMKKILERRPSVLILYPTLLGTLGGMGSIIGSTTTTRLHLGELPPHAATLKKVSASILAAEAASGPMHVLYGAGAFLLASKVMLLNAQLDKLILASILTNLLSFLPICLFSFLVAIITFRKGFDPDNFVIPIETSVSDALGTLSLFIAASIVY
ncbi:TPA: hypothetical protein EYP26_03110 [Candidatus Bathyarchaeota archaeon]|nr:hypothetical protein [Candidatus Bathyarchaeota archaeon]